VLAKRRQSLAWRLTTTYLVTTLLIVVILSVTVYVSTALYLDDRLDTELNVQADFYATYAADLASDGRLLGGLAPTIVDLFAPQADLNVRLFANNGALLAATQDIGPQPSRAALTQLGYRSPTVFTQPSRDLPHRRYAARPIVVGDQTIGVVEVSQSTRASERFLTTLRHILLATIIVAALVSLLVSLLLARRLSRPIHDMERATRRIAAGDLGVRLDGYPPDEIGRLAESINWMTERLEHLEAARTRFISEISHDLRTPLTAIKGLLVNLIDDGSEPSQRARLEIAERETDRLIHLVSQLLDLARWQGGRLELNRRPVDVGAIACDAVALSEGRARHRQITLSADVPANLPTISADRDRVQRVILNLLDNGIKFTPGGGAVTLTARRKASEIEISVQDSGRGMNDEEQGRAFEPYYRGQGGGAGLGLTIARAIVEAHGGWMGIESAKGQGSRVWFTLPCNNC
jgi:signal transduction histidine kinase